MLPHARLADYTQAQMDLGATLCTRADPACVLCPLQDDCVARREGRVAELPTPKPGKTAAAEVRARAVAGRRRRPQCCCSAARRPASGRRCGRCRRPTMPRRARDWFERTVARRLRRRRGAARRSTTPSATTGCSCNRCAGAASHCAHASATMTTCAGSRASELAALGIPAPIRKLLEDLNRCPAPSTANTNSAKPKASTSCPGPANSASACSPTSASRRGRRGSRTRPC